MPRLKKCKLCGLPIQPDEPFVPIEQRYAHERCFDNWSKTLIGSKSKSLKEKKKTKTEKKRKVVPELKDGLSEEEYQEKVRYYQYFGQLVEEISPKIRKLSEDYMRKYRISYKELYQTLMYLNEISSVDLKGDIIGILPFYFTQAKNYYEELKVIEKNNENVQPMYQHKKIQVKPKKRKIIQLDITEE